MSSPAAHKIREWREVPGRFVREVLRVDEVDAWQDEVLEAAVSGKKRIALKASKGPGKSTVLAWLAWWFLFTRAHPKVVATSISGDNLRDGLWTELAKWQQKAPLLKEAFTWSVERVVSKEYPETWWASARQWAKSADASQQANTLAGIHADNVLFLVDEAGGIPDAVVAAAEAGLANADKERGTEALLVIAGNPTHLEGPLYRACTREREMWFVKEISGDPDDPKRAKRVSIEWAREQIRKWGRESPYVLVNVFGQFPPGQSNALLGIDEVTKASTRTLAERDYTSEPKVLGIDVARFGDDRTVFFLRQGRVAFRPKVIRDADTMEVAGQAAALINKLRPDATFIDATGVGGGVVDRLRELQFSVLGVDGANSPSDDRFLNKRAEMWLEMAEWLRGGGIIPDDGELISELTAPTYKFTSNGQQQLESKADLKKRGLPSPDKADALALTFSYPVARAGLLQRNNAAAPRCVTEYDPFAKERSNG